MPDQRRDAEARSWTGAVTAWFRRHARDLPWRRQDVRDGYAALVSEAMLQQTQVARVVDAFPVFMERFPTVHALAAADEQEVLALWSGLGYYRRARLLHAAARAIVEGDGAVPRTAASLLDLPGVGRYTAGAIASIVHGERAPIVDGNVARVLMRVHGVDAPTGDAAAMRWSWTEAERLVRSARDPGAFNEGLMELGATVCTPRAPRCTACPVAGGCVVHAEGDPERTPRPRKTAPRAVLHHQVVPVARDDRVLLRRRPDVGLWAGLHECPTIESPTLQSARAVLAALGVDESSSPVHPPLRIRRAERFVHLTSHREVHFTVYRPIVLENPPEGRWCTAEDLPDVPMSTPQRRIVRAVLERLVSRS